MQKALMEMNLQLHHVVSDITGATGMRIIRAIVGGERNLDVLATYRDVRCHSSVETIRAAGRPQVGAGSMMNPCNHRGFDPDRLRTPAASRGMLSAKQRVP
jgi:hypothetical protein